MDESTAPQDLKHCGMCGTNRPLEMFHRHGRTADGRQTYCKECLNAARRARKAKGVLGERARRNREIATAQTLARGSKVCTRCEGEKPLSEFAARKQSLDGLGPHCRECRVVIKAAEYVRNRERYERANRAAYEAQREARLEYQKQWAAENREKRLEIEARRRARKRGATVTRADVDALWDGACALCGDAIDPALTSPHPMSRSLDHIIPLSLGGSHEQSNLQWTHLRCNIRKGARLTA